MKKYILFLTVFATIIVILFSGCGTNPATSNKTTNAPTSPAAQPSTSVTSSTEAGTPKNGGTFTLILTGSPGGNIGWPPEFLGNDSTTPQMIYEGLLRSLRDGSSEPLLATGYKLADDRLSCTYYIRQGVKFHDGTDLNAEAVKFNFEATMAANLQVWWDHVEVIDSYTIKVYFKEYRNGLEFSVGQVSIASPTAAQKGGNLDYIRKNPCGTGPFTFVSFQQDESFVAKKNPNYWDKGHMPYLDELKIIYIPDQMTLKAAMQKGDADAVPVELGKLARDFLDMNFNVLTQHQAVFSLFFDSKNPESPFAKKEVREAVAYAINKDAIANDLGYGLFKPPKNIIAEDNVAYTDTIAGKPFDPDKARELLKKAGYPNGFETQITPHEAADKDINLAIQQYLNDVGIKVKINYVTNTQYLELRAGNYSGMLLEPFAAFANFGMSLGMYMDQQSIFFVNMDKPDEMQAYLDRLAHSPVFPDIDIIREMVSYVNDNTCIVPVYDGGMGYALATRVHGDAFLTLSFPPFFVAQNIWVDPK